ncbi:MAG: PIN domain-containing protein [Pirellulales bacterium]
MRKTFVLIDLENVQPDGIGRLADARFHVLVFVGANQAKISFEIAESLQKMGGRAEYIRIASSGRNALDFHIAFYVGKIASAHSAACFQIVSRDTGFDLLIAHLQSQRICVHRVEAVEKIPLQLEPSREAKVAPSEKPALVGTQLAPGSLGAERAKTTAERMELLIARLREKKPGKPNSVTSLKKLIVSYFRKEITDKQADEVVRGMVDLGVFAISGQKVVYR